MAIKTRKVQGKANETFESFIFNGKNNVEVVEFFLDRGERADNFGDHIAWSDPDTGRARKLYIGDRVVIAKDQAIFLQDDVFKLFFETAKTETPAA